MFNIYILFLFGVLDKCFCEFGSLSDLDVEHLERRRQAVPDQPIYLPEFPSSSISLSLFTFIFLMLINLYFSGWNFTFSSSLLSPFQAFSLSYLWQAVPDQPIYLRLEFCFSSLFITFVFFSSFTFEDSSRSDPLKFPTKN